MPLNSHLHISAKYLFLTMYLWLYPLYIFSAYSLLFSFSLTLSCFATHFPWLCVNEIQCRTGAFKCTVGSTHPSLYLMAEMDSY